MLKLAAFTCLSVVCFAIPAESNKDVPPPAPTAVRDAKKVFLTNSRASDPAFNAFYSAMETWGRYRIVGSRDEADLIVELACRFGNGRTWLDDEYYGAPDGSRRHDGYYGSREQILTTTTLTIFDAKSKKRLWSSFDRRKLALRQKNREKDAVNSAQKLVEELKTAVKVPA